MPVSAGFVLRLVFDAEGGGDICYRNVVISPNYMALESKKTVSHDLTVYSSPRCLLSFDSYVKYIWINIPAIFS
jgi:hypothetical protein